ncbi:MAG: hypothetical protein OEL87_01380 [Nanoarchaeota archaeon]|nr:hypothetical protein [Nanoarchaeota archaeon]
MIVYLKILFFYALICKAWPYFLYPNYAKKSKIETYPELRKLALKIKRKDKLSTIKTAYNYMSKTYSGHAEQFRPKSLLTIFHLGDFNTKSILNKKQFLWCHNQNRLLKSILINTELFTPDEIVIKKHFFKSFFIHQWVVISLKNQKIKIDPFYNILEVVKKQSC